MKSLKISKEISLPIQAVTETFAAIGRKGAGKTYLATMIAEQMLDASAQVVIIDPVGNWWGLRVDADGKSKGKEIFVIGGEYGDVPLVPEAGSRIAKLLVEKNISAVLDVSGFRLGEHKRFAADFAEEFFHLKKSHRTPVHVFIEEAQKLIPQRVSPDEARMVGAFEQIVRLGRNYGIGCTLVTQRPQSVNKEVLSQVECLCVLQVTGPHERKALEEWVQEVGADRKLIGELPGLSRGEGYVWSPSWLRVYERVHFLTKRTFDSSATPIVGKETKATTVLAVDVESLKKDMAEVVAQAEKDDPAALHRKIAEFKRHKCPVVNQNPVKIQKIEVPTFGKKTLEKMFDLHGNFRMLVKKSRELQKTSISTLEELQKYLNRFGSELEKANLKPTSLDLPKKITVIESSKEDIDVYGKISNPEKRILDSIVWMESIGISEPEQTAVAFLAGYTYGGGAFNNPKGALRTKGLVEYVNGGNIKLTDTGRKLAKVPDTPLTTEELHIKVLSVLETPHQKILKPLLERYPEAISGQELAELSGYTFGSGAFNNPKGRLRSLGLIEYMPGGMIKARDILFL